MKEMESLWKLKAVSKALAIEYKMKAFYIDITASDKLILVADVWDVDSFDKDKLNDVIKVETGMDIIIKVVKAEGVLKSIKSKRKKNKLLISGYVGGTTKPIHFIKLLFFWIVIFLVPISIAAQGLMYYTFLLAGIPWN